MNNTPEWLKLSTPDGDPVLVQVSRISHITQYRWQTGEPAVVHLSGLIWFGDSSNRIVRETVEEIAALLGIEV